MPIRWRQVHIKRISTSSTVCLYKLDRVKGIIVRKKRAIYEIKNKRLAKVRQYELGLTNKDIAAISGASHYVYTKWVKGKRLMQLDALAEVAVTLEVNVDDLINISTPAPKIFLDKEKLLDLLNEKEWSLLRLSKRSGVSYSVCYSATSGRNEMHPYSFLAIADTLGVEIKDIIKEVYA